MRSTLLLLAASCSSLAALAQSLPSVSTAALLQRESAAASGLPESNRPGRIATTVVLPGHTVSYRWNSNGQAWMLPTVRTTTYTATGQLLVVVTADSATRVPTSRVTHHYTPAGQLSNVLTETWNGSAYVNSGLTTYAYDGQDRLTGAVAQTWTGGAWQNSNRNLQQFDAQGNQTEQTTASWTNNAWVTTSGHQYAYTYGAGGSIQQIEISHWILADETFRTMAREVLTYGANPRQWLTLTHQQYSGTWFDVERLLNPVFDAQNRLTYHELQNWSGSAWQTIGRTTTAYNPANPGLVQTVEAYDQNGWRNTSRYSETYDANGPYTGAYSELWQNAAWVPMNGIRYRLRYNASNVPDQRVSQIVSAASNSFSNSVKERYSNFQTIILASRPVVRVLPSSLFPNPTTGAALLRVEGLGRSAEAQAEVLNVLGQVVQRLRLPVQQGRVAHPVDLSALPAGRYTVRLHTAEATVVKAIVRE